MTTNFEKTLGTARRLKRIASTCLENISKDRQSGQSVKTGWEVSRI